MATIDGTGGQDVLTGTHGDDLILGRGGDDFIYGRDGDDVLKGGSGGDVICDRLDIHKFGPNGNDLMAGGGGNDQLVTLNGDDTLLGGGGDDDLVIFRQQLHNDDTVIAQGGAGNDLFYFSSYNAGEHVKLYGGAGDDRFELWGSKGTLHVDLGEGHDMVWAASRYANGDGPIAISHFDAGDDGDVLVLDGGGVKGYPKYFQGLIYLHKGDNPFEDGHLRLVQDGADVVMEVDATGHKFGESYSVSVIFKDADIGDFTAANFGGYDPMVTG
jgi:Ca2+-binding RTX toxin-like protein